jgi:glycosyltransferase involved in cell wall biosynthesis
MTEQPDGVTVITLTRRRPTLVRRAMRSVAAQRTDHPVHHVVLIDDCPDTRDALAAVADEHPGVDIRYMPRAAHEVSGPGRSSRLRNHGARTSADSWIAYLDDDNEWTPEHLDTLLACVREHEVQAAHSYVSLCNPDGTPYLRHEWPWARDREQARRIYADYLAKGILISGSNIVADRPGHHDEPADSSSWLFARELLLRVPFSEQFSPGDAANLIGEDDKMYWALVDRGESFACTRRATLRYYLGGYSNNVHGKTDETFSWANE